MKLGRRNFLAFLGLGSAAAPVALPAFGKAISSKGMHAGLGYTIDRLSDAEGPSMLDPVYDTVADAARRTLFNKPIKEVIDIALNEGYQSARERARNFRQHADDMYNLPSWSPSYRKYVARREMDRREEETKTWGERIKEATMKFWNDNGGSEDYFNVKQDKAMGSIGGNAARSRR
jgi:hypothetical protein